MQKDIKLNTYVPLNENSVISVYIPRYISKCNCLTTNKKLLSLEHQDTKNTSSKKVYGGRQCRKHYSKRYPQNVVTLTKPYIFRNGYKAKYPNPLSQSSLQVQVISGKHRQLSVKIKYKVVYGFILFSWGGESLFAVAINARQFQIHQNHLSFSLISFRCVQPVLEIYICRTNCSSCKKEFCLLRIHFSSEVNTG